MKVIWELTAEEIKEAIRWWMGDAKNRNPQNVFLDTHVTPNDRGPGSTTTISARVIVEDY